MTVVFLIGFMVGFALCALAVYFDSDWPAF